MLDMGLPYVRKPFICLGSHLCAKGLHTQPVSARFFSFLTSILARFSKMSVYDARLTLIIGGKERVTKICVGTCSFYMFAGQIRMKSYSTNISYLSEQALRLLGTTTTDSSYA
jgi:hypothetical protein